MRNLNLFALLAFAAIYTTGSSQVEKRDALDALAPKDQYCAVSSGHTACKYRKTNQENKCGTIAKRELTAEQKQGLLDAHNKLRRKVAKGQQSGQPSAANMAKLEWDDEAAAIAQVWVDQCFGLQHDSSRETVKGGKAYNGQNLYMGFGRQGMFGLGQGLFGGSGSRPWGPSGGVQGGQTGGMFPGGGMGPGGGMFPGGGMGSGGGMGPGSGMMPGGGMGPGGGMMPGGGMGPGGGMMPGGGMGPNGDDDDTGMPSGGQSGGTGGQSGGNGASMPGGNSGDFNVESAVQMWFDEVKQFSPSGVSSFSFSGNTGHYTQLVWAETTKIGCGYIKYSGGEVLACNYKPGGNMMGAPIYKTGSSCSACPSSLSKCDDGLCTK